MKGIDRKGEKASNASLTDEKVLLIIDLLIANELTITEIAEMFGVTHHVIKHINNGSTWSHLYEKSPLELGRKVVHADNNGEKNPKAQLTDEDVYNIKHKLTHGATRKEIEKEYRIRATLTKNYKRCSMVSYWIWRFYCEDWTVRKGSKRWRS